MRGGVCYTHTHTDTHTLTYAYGNRCLELVYPGVKESVPVLVFKHSRCMRVRVRVRVRVCVYVRACMNGRLARTAMTEEWSDLTPAANTKVADTRTEPSTPQYQYIYSTSTSSTTTVRGMTGGGTRQVGRARASVSV